MKSSAIRVGMAIQNQHGSISFADRKGKEAGLRLGIEALCEVTGIEMSAERQHELRKLAVDDLAALLRRIKTERRWS